MTLLRDSSRTSDGNEPRLERSNRWPDPIEVHFLPPNFFLDVVEAEISFASLRIVRFHSVAEPVLHDLCLLLLAVQLKAEFQMVGIVFMPSRRLSD